MMVGWVGHGNLPKTGSLEKVFSEFIVWNFGEVHTA
jgi:hypothetical protein